MDKEDSPEEQDETADWPVKAFPPWPGLGGLAGIILLPSQCFPNEPRMSRDTRVCVTHS